MGIGLWPFDSDGRLARTDDSLGNRVPCHRFVVPADLCFKFRACLIVANKVADHLNGTGDVVDVDIDTTVPGNFGNGASVAADTDLSHRERFADRKPPSLIQGGTYGKQAPVIQRMQ